LRYSGVTLSSSIGAEESDDDDEESASRESGARKTRLKNPTVVSNSAVEKRIRIWWVDRNEELPPDLTVTVSNSADIKHYLFQRDYTYRSENSQNHQRHCDSVVAVVQDGEHHIGSIVGFATASCSKMKLNLVVIRWLGKCVLVPSCRLWTVEHQAEKLEVLPIEEVKLSRPLVHVTENGQLYILNYLEFYYHNKSSLDGLF
jgi:hypothetical protein